MTQNIDRAPIEDPNASLERALIEEFIRARGFDPMQLHALPDDQRRRLWGEASAHAAARLTEMEARAHYIDELHGQR
jgi:hypothetical protein